MKAKYYGKFSSNLRTLSGCSHIIISQAFDNQVDIPFEVETNCKLCQKKHKFNLVNRYVMYTKSQEENLYKRMEEEGIEIKMDV